jgi:hypothetical protein
VLPNVYVDWYAPDQIAGTGYTDLWTILPPFSGDTTTTLSHFDGTKNTKVASVPGRACGMAWLAANDIWFSPCSDGGDSVFHYDGKTFDKIPTGMAALGYQYGGTMWGTDTAHLWIGNAAGHVLRYKP